MQIELVKHLKTDDERSGLIEKHKLVDVEKNKSYRLSQEWFGRFLPFMKQISFSSAFGLGIGMAAEGLGIRKGKEKKVESLFREFMEFRKKRRKRILIGISLALLTGVALLVL